MAEKDDLLDAREAFRLAEDASSENRQAALDDIKFARMGEQWSEQDKRRREKEGRPCLTINRLPAFARQVVNDCRQNRPAIQVLPASDQADVQTAAIITGLVRNIEATSDADVAYDTAIESAVYGGFGYWRIDLDYAHSDSFDLDIRIGRVANPFTVYADHRSTSADSSDWQYAFVTELMPQAEFKRKYKEAAPSDWDSAGDGQWFLDDSVRVAEWWRRDEVARKLLKLSDGTILPEERFLAEQDFLLGAGLQVVGERTTTGYKVSQKLITGTAVLDEKDWSGQYIPIIPVYGDEVNIEGKRYFRSLIRDARDPQRMFNYWRTAATEMVALAPKVPFIGPRGAFSTDAEKWATANSVSHAYIEYDGPMPPQRQPLDTGAAAGALQEALNAADDMKAIMGIYDAGLGAKSNETSGIAIRRRQRESDTSTFHFIDNLNRAVRHCGRVLLDLIPVVYTSGRVIRILGEDMAPSSVPLGQPQGQMPGQMPGQIPMQGQMPPPNPVTKVYDLSVGKYDVVVKAGPSYSTRREEAAEQQIAFMQAVPQMAPLMTDILAQNLDWPQADKLKQRIEQQMANPPPNPEQMKAQAQGQIEQMKVQAQAQLKQMEAQVQMQLEQAKAAAEAERAKLLAEVDLMKSRAQAELDLQKADADNQAKAAITQAQIDSQERMKAADITARRQEKLLELSAGILAARQSAQTRNLVNDSTLDQNAQGVGNTDDISTVAKDIEGLAQQADSGQPVVSHGPKQKKKPRKARFQKQADGSWLAESLDD